MRFRFFLTLGCIGLSVLPSLADDLKPGKSFPNHSFAPISGGEPVAMETMFGEKMMLHVFASW